MTRKINLALGGGGLKGYAHIGVIDQLEKFGYEIAAIAGTSAGGIVGALYAYGYSIQEIVVFIDELRTSNLFARQANDSPSLIGLKGLYSFLDDKFGQKRIEDLKIPFAVTAVDLNNRNEVIINSGNLVNAVKATTAVPGIFPSIKIKGFNLVDGGILDPVPVEVARWLNNTNPLVAVCLSSNQSSWSVMDQLHIPSFSPVPPIVVEQISEMRIGKAMKVFLNAMDIMVAQLSNIRLQIEKPDVVIRPNIHQYFMFEDVDPRELIRRGQEAVQKEQSNISSAFQTSQKVARWMKPTKLPGQLLDEQSYESLPE